MPTYAKAVADEVEAKERQDEADRLKREAAAKQVATEAWVLEWLGRVDQGTMQQEEFERRIAAMDKGEEVESEEEKKRSVGLSRRKCSGPLQADERRRRSGMRNPMAIALRRFR